MPYGTNATTITVTVSDSDGVPVTVLLSASGGNLSPSTLIITGGGSDTATFSNDGSWTRPGSATITADVTSSGYTGSGNITVTFATPATITATATGSPTFTTAAYPQLTITNGDFLIKNTLQGPTPQPSEVDIGDGCNEGTAWTFDLTHDANYAVFAASPSLSAAKLTLTLTATTLYNNDTSTDFVVLVGSGKNITTSEIKSLPPGVTRTIVVDLLAVDAYQPQDILEEFTTNAGKISFEYWDDAFITSATIELTQ